METLIKEKIKQIKKGDQTAFEDVVSFYQNKVYFIGYFLFLSKKTQGAVHLV